MRQIKHIVVHCTATGQSATVEAIKRYWRNTLGWKNPGYHYIYTPGGKETELLPENKIANGVRGKNRHSIHLSYIGGIKKEKQKDKYVKLPIDNRTHAQKRAMYNRIIDLMRRYPEAKLVGHNELANRDCPCFDVTDWIKNHQISLTT